MKMDEYLKYIILLEKALAEYYEKLKKEDDLQRISTSLEFMETHSSMHAERVEGLAEELERPMLDNNFVLNVQNNITKKVTNILKVERDLPVILETLADSEEEVGKMYEKISWHMLKLSDYYKELSGRISELAKEEMDHRDILLKDRDALKKH